MLQESVNSWKAFLHCSAGCGSIFPAKSCQDAWRSSIRLARGHEYARWGKTLRRSLCNFWNIGWRRIVRSCLEKNWALSVDPCQLPALQFSVYLIDLLSMLLRCNGFTRTQKAVVEQTGSTKQWPWPFLVQVWLWEMLQSFSSSHWAGRHQLSCKIHFLLQITIRWEMFHLLRRVGENDTSKWQFFFYFQSLHEAHIYRAFSPFQFAPNAEWL